MSTLPLIVVWRCFLSASPLVDISSYAGNTTKSQAEQVVTAGPIIAGTICKPDSFFYYFDLQKCSVEPGQIRLKTGVELWAGPRIPLTIEEKSPFVRVEVYRPGDVDCRTAPLIRHDSPAFTVTPGRVCKVAVPFQAKIAPRAEPYVVVIRLLNPTPNGGETQHVLQRISYQVTGSEPSRSPAR